MGALKPEVQKIEVDMVPLIDVIVLLLMFLVIVGDLAATASNIPMKLPRAAQAKSEKEWDFKNLKGRLVIQLTPEKDSEGVIKSNGRYFAVINNVYYDLAPGGGTSLLDFLKGDIALKVARGEAILGPDKAVTNIAVKLRIPANCPMYEAERLITGVASVGLVNVHYAADFDKTVE
jgi:hypothetical protein